MKFAHNYQLALQQGDFPSSWVDSAIHYKRLKACIRLVRLELSKLGLDSETVSSIVKSKAHANHVLISLQYIFRGCLPF